MLRGVDPRDTGKALDGIMAKLTERGLPVLVPAMLAAPNLGADYGQAFNGLYPALAEKYGALFYPFFLDGVAGDPPSTRRTASIPIRRAWTWWSSASCRRWRSLIDRIEDSR